VSRISDLDAAMLRAYGEDRCLDYGCAAPDVHELRDRVEQGEAWSDVAFELGERKATAGNALAAEQGTRASARAALLHGAACLRVAQAAQEAMPSDRLQTYERQATLFAAAQQYSSVSCESLQIAWHGADHQAWLFSHEGASRWVVVWGGADGWCEAYHRSVKSFSDQGLSVCLVELPGQGLARLRNGSFLARDIGQFVSHVLDLLQVRTPGAASFAAVGHSLGGCLALRAAAEDERIVACVTNGGSVRMARGFIAYPRVLARFARMLGDDVGSTEALAFVDALALDRSAADMRASLLCLHGDRDELVHDDEVRELIGLHGRARLKAWPDGLHCIYNHADERNQVLAAWVADQLP
jgi:alpha-beta hydrolase superfamily lysophospholipase